MIFLLLMVVWTAAMTTAPMLIIPFVALLIRSSYVGRRIRMRKGFVLVAVLLFAYLLISLPLEEAAVWALRSLLMLMVLDHVLGSARASSVSLRLLPYSLAHYIHLINRSARLTRERVSDVFYARQVRLSELRGFSRVRERLVVSFGVAVASIREMDRLQSHLNAVIVARGEFPHPKLWQDKHSVQAVLYMADGLVFALAVLGIIAPLDWLVPEHWSQALQRIVQIVGVGQ